MQKRINGVYLVRDIATLGIVVYHFQLSAIQQGYTGFLLRIGAWGNFCTTIFFVLSGFLLYYQYNEKIHSIRDVLMFYKKRIVTIMIPFWLVWGGLFAIKAFRAGSFFYAGKPLMLLLSLVASDGYWQSPYYEIGEWFLGALVILYFIYPFILFALKRRPLLTTVFMFAGYLIGLHIQIGGWDIPFRGIFTCGLSFFLGMLLSKEYTSILREKRVWGIVTGFLSLHFYTNIPPLPLDSVTYCILTGTVIFVFLLILGNEITTHAGTLKVLQKAASISYEVFLVHHVIYYSLEPFFESFVHNSSMNVNLAVTVALFLYLLAVIPAAILLHCISRYILNAFSLEKRKTGTNQNENQNLMKY